MLKPWLSINGKQKLSLKNTEIVQVNFNLELRI